MTRYLLNEKGGDPIEASTIFLLVKVSLRWLAATGKCLKAKETAGETIDWSDRLECAVTGLSGLEDNILPLIDKVKDKDGK